MTNIAASYLTQGLVPTPKTKLTASDDKNPALTPLPVIATPLSQTAIQDKNAVEGRVATPQTQVDTQLLATGETETQGMSAKDEFLKFASMSWQDRMRAMMLKSFGLSEEDLARMSPEEQAKIAAKIEEKIKQEIEKHSGIATMGAA